MSQIRIPADDVDQVDAAAVVRDLAARYRLARVLVDIAAVDPSRHGQTGPDTPQITARYARRNGLIWQALALAHDAGVPAGVGYDPTDPRPVVVYLDLPTGQVSWHLPPYPGEWDGHSTDQKYRRLDAMVAGDDEMERIGMTTVGGDTMTWDTAERIRLADECERGAAALTAEAEAAEDNDRRDRKLRAAETVRAYAERVRAGAAGSVGQAEMVALAARSGGVLVGVETDWPSSPWTADVRPVEPREAARGLVDAGVLVRIARPGQTPYLALAGYAPAA